MSLEALDLADFERAAERIAESVEGEPNNLAVLVAAGLTQLDAAALDDEEVHRRTRRFIEILPSTAAVQRALAIAARGTNQAVKSAVVAAVSRDLRGLIYSSGVPADEVAVERSPPVHASEELTARGAPRAPADDSRTVLLLGDRQDIEVNAHLLSSHGFGAIHVGSTERLEVLRGERFCGIVVYESWRSILLPVGLAAFLEAQLDHANLVYYRVDVHELGAPDAADLQALRGKYDSHVRANVVFADGCNLVDTDIVELERVAALLAFSESAHITIDGLSSQERRILCAAVTTFESQTRGVQVRAAPEIVVSPLTAGRSGARVLRVMLAGNRSVVVAKLDAAERLSAEMRRARALTSADQALPMAVYSLEGTAVLVQQLVADADRTSQAAPSLKERLELLAAVEGGRQNVVSPEKEALLVGLRRAFEAVHALNSIPPGSADKECWTGTEPIASHADFGINWRLEAEDGGFDAREPLPAIEARLSDLEATISVHGDLHSGNVLLPDDRVPRLVDFAQAGAGHPAFDLVRLSSAISYASLRCLVPEAEMRAYFGALHTSSKSADELADEFPMVVAGASAEIANAALVLGRDAALAALPEGAEGRAHYWAMVYLIGVQSLTRREFQAGVVRAALGAIKLQIDGDPEAGF